MYQVDRNHTPYPSQSAAHLDKRSFGLNGLTGSASSGANVGAGGQMVGCLGASILLCWVALSGPCAIRTMP